MAKKKKPNRNCVSFGPHASASNLIPLGRGSGSRIAAIRHDESNVGERESPLSRITAPPPPTIAIERSQRPREYDWAGKHHDQAADARYGDKIVKAHEQRREFGDHPFPPNDLRKKSKQSSNPLDNVRNSTATSSNLIPLGNRNRLAGRYREAHHHSQGYSRESGSALQSGGKYTNADDYFRPSSHGYRYLDYGYNNSGTAASCGSVSSNPQLRGDLFADLEYRNESIRNSENYGLISNLPEIVPCHEGINFEEFMIYDLDILRTDALALGMPERFCMPGSKEDIARWLICLYEVTDWSNDDRERVLNREFGPFKLQAGRSAKEQRLFMATTYWATGICKRSNLLCKDPRQVREMAQEKGIDMKGEQRTFEVVWAMELLNRPLQPDNLKQEELVIGFNDADSRSIDLDESKDMPNKRRYEEIDAQMPGPPAWKRLKE